MKLDIDECLIKYFDKSQSIISWKEYITFNGFNKFGPSSNSHKLVVMFEENKKYYFSTFHKQDFFDGSKEKYFPLNSLPKELDFIFNRNNYFSVDFLDDLKVLLLNKFPDLVVKLMVEFLVRKSFKNCNLSLNRRQIGENILIPIDSNQSIVINIG